MLSCCVDVVNWGDISGTGSGLAAVNSSGLVALPFFSFLLLPSSRSHRGWSMKPPMVVGLMGEGLGHRRRGFIARAHPWRVADGRKQGRDTCRAIKGLRLRF